MNSSIKILNANEKKRIEKKLQEQFGIKNISGILVMRGAERIFLFSGDFSEDDIKELEKEVVIERVGVYFAKEQNEEVRLSIEGVHILKDQIIKNIFEVNEKQAEQWMKGQELNIKTGKNGFVILKHGEDFLGCGKASEEKITNFIPKNRRLKEKS